MSEPSKKTFMMAHPVIAVVCDIRGFTDFTSTVDCVNQSEQVYPRRKMKLLEAYDELVKDTQLTAIQAILEPIIGELKNSGSELRKEWDDYRGKDEPVPCALKSTGDGFLVAVELADKYSDVPLKLQSLLAEAMTRGVIKLVTDAAEKTGKFRRLLKKFVGIWGDLLALRLDETTFRVAGAIALGTGQVLEEDVPPTWAAARMLEPIVGKLPVLKLKSDAYGHGVNLAFRLCDRAGRAKKKGDDENMGPYVLLDRRIGQLLIYEVPESNKGEGVTAPGGGSQRQTFRMRTFDEYSHTRFLFDEPLKGIDELWCYALKKETEEKPPTAGRSGEGSLETGPTEESGEEA